MNLTGVKAKDSYKGILNLAGSNQILDATLRVITDGMGNNSPLQLSTGEASVSAYLSIGNVINATGFGQRLRVIGQGDASIGVYRNQASSSPAKFEFMKSRGTYDVPLVVNNLDELGSLGYFGFNGTSYSNSARVYARAVSSTGTGVEGELLTALWNNTGGNLNMLRLTILGLGIGNALDYTPSARLHVRGDGTNPIARFENSAGTPAFAINNNGGITIARDGNIGPQIYPFNLSEITTDILGFGLGFTSNKVNFASNNYDVFFNGQAYTTTSGVANYVTIRRTFAAAAGAASFRPLNLEYTINTTGAQTGTATGIFLNATETALNGMGHNLIDLQVGGVSQFRVSRIGVLTAEFGVTGNNASAAFQINGRWALSGTALGTMLFQPWSGTALMMQFGGTTNAFSAIKRNGAAIDFRLADDSGFCNINALNVFGTNLQFSGVIQDSNNGTNIDFPSNGVITLFNNGSTDFGRLQLGGTTNAFPAIKRNGAAIEARLADDSNYTDINAFNFNLENTGYIGQRTNSSYRITFVNTGILTYTAPNGHSLNSPTIIGATGGSLNASAILQADSTTRGFLPPRMTTTQINAIATPAEGLVVFNTTISHLCVYQSGAWVRMSHSPM